MLVSVHHLLLQISTSNVDQHPFETKFNSNPVDEVSVKAGPGPKWIVVVLKQLMPISILVLRNI